jgi:PBP1b-binding outer membrane lipoprotein LpoB
MKSAPKLIRLALVATCALAFAGCTPPATDAAETKADAYEKEATDLRESVNSKTDDMTASAKAMRESLDEAGKSGEEAINKSGEVFDGKADEKADKLEDAAAVVREANPK